MGETDMRAQEADCDEREARLLPEYRRCIEALDAAEEHARELHARKDESRRQQMQLMQRQRDLGGAEIRISGIESALRRQQDTGTPKFNRPAVSVNVEEMQKRLARLRHADAEWAEQVQRQQAEIHRLEMRVELLAERAKAPLPMRGGVGGAAPRVAVRGGDKLGPSVTRKEVGLAARNSLDPCMAPV